MAAHILTGKGKHGFSDKHRGQLMVLTGTFEDDRSWTSTNDCSGPMLCAGKELAEAASQALDTEIEFENISEYVTLSMYHRHPD